MTFQNDMIYLGASSITNGVRKQEFLGTRYANRHGLIAGATGTGKTVSLQILAEGFSNEGIAVFAADVKGDLSGLGVKGEAQDFLEARAKEIGFETFAYESSPVILWDLYGERGHPIRATVTELGPVLLSRILSLNDTQEGVLNIVFKYADDNGLLLLDLKDLRKVLELLGSDDELQKELKTSYGNISDATVGAIQRQLLVLEQQGGAQFFGEPAFDVRDLLRTTHDGKGFINILSAEKLTNAPRFYSTFLLWLLSELFEELPEVGDQNQPKLVFFFDEAHLLFNEASDALLEKIEQVVRLIRSKGVGIFFVTQNPLDIPDKIAAQLGNRIQHALRAYTPREQKAVKTAAETFRQNTSLNTAQVITELSKGEALVSVLEAEGTPSIVQRVKIRPPSSKLGPLSDEERRQLIDTSPLHGKYEGIVDRESAYEILQVKAESAQQVQEKQATGFWGRVLGEGSHSGRQRMGMGESVAKSVARSVSSTLGRQIAGAVVGAVLGKASSRRSASNTGTRIATNVAKNVGSAVARRVGTSIVRGVLGGLSR